MSIYLPIAELSIDVLLLLALGGGVGLLSGLFGVGGGFLMTPLLIFIGVPPAVAVGSQANQLVATSVSGALAHWRRRNVDIRIGLVMLGGSLVGTAIGVVLFGFLKQLGLIDFVVSVSYVVFLGIVGGLMLIESARAIIQRKRGRAPWRKLHKHNWMHGLPLKMKFPRSRLYISALMPAAIGFVGGLLVAIMGVGGGFILVPAMIYMLGMPAALVAGTSLFQIIFTTAFATILQAVLNNTVDAILALILLLGAVVGAPLGTAMGARLRGDVSRLLLSVLVLLVGARLFYALVATPDDPFSLVIEVAS